MQLICIEQTVLNINLSLKESFYLRDH